MFQIYEPYNLFLAVENIEMRTCQDLVQKLGFKLRQIDYSQIGNEEDKCVVTITTFISRPMPNQ